MKHTLLARGSLVIIYFLAGLTTMFLARLPLTWATAELWTWLKILHYIILAIVAGGVLVSVIRRATNRVWWEGLLNAALLFGAWYALAVMPWPFFAAVMSAIGVTLIFFWWHTILVHNLFYILGAVGLALNFASYLPFEVALVGLVAFAIYDMVCVRSAETHLRLTKLLSPYGLAPGFILPQRFKDWFSKINPVGAPAIALGLSELVLPLVLIVKSAHWNSWAPAMVVGGLTLGAAVYGWRSNFSERFALAYVSAGMAISFLVLYLAQFQFFNYLSP